MSDFITVTATGANVASGAASASVAIPVASSGERPRFIRVNATVAARVRMGLTGLTAVATDLLVQPGDAVIMHVPSGITHIAALQDVAAGVVAISPMENVTF